MTREPLDRSAYGVDDPIRLKLAAQVAFPDGSMTESGLKREHGRGNLAIEVIAGKQYTTLNDIKAMREKCRENQRERGSTGANRALADRDNGLSSTERLSVAQAAASMIAQGLKQRCKPSSQKSTVPTGGEATRLK